MKENTPVAIRREDYRPPAYTASHIDLRFDGPDSWFRIVDDGSGMTGSEITEAMRYGAQQAYGEEDLGKFPRNGWSLHGLAEARRALGEPTAELEAAHREAWQYADIEPTAGAE